MKRITALLHPNRIGEVVHALAAAGHRRFSVLHAQGLLQALSTREQTYSVELGKGIGADIQERIGKLRSLMEQYAADDVARGAYEAEINFLMFKLAELGLAKVTTVNGEQVVDPGRSGNPSPYEIATTQIKQYQMQLMSETGKVSGSGQLISNTATLVVGSCNTIGTSSTPGWIARR